MNYHLPRWPTWVLLLIWVSGWLVAPAWAAPRPKVADILLSGPDRSAASPGLSFSTETPVIHAQVKLTGSRPGIRIAASWVAVDALSTPDYPIAGDEVTLDKSGRAQADFQLERPERGWPPGRYRLEVRLDGQLAKQLAFSIGVEADSQAMAPAPPPGPADQLLGAWACRGNQGASSLDFLSGEQLSYNGEQLGYARGDGVLRVFQAYGWVDYPYRHTATGLEIRLPDGDRLVCARRNQTASGSVASPAGGENHLLAGWFCSWSGSSNSYSGTSYSSSNRAQFDGRGQFSYGGESSFNVQSGMGYGQSGRAVGSYQVRGNQVQLRFADGSSGTATVHHRSGDGRITELMYAGKLYAGGLCE